MCVLFLRDESNDYQRGRGTALPHHETNKHTAYKYSGSRQQNCHDKLSREKVRRKPQRVQANSWMITKKGG